MTRAERRARPSVAIAAQQRAIRVRAEQRKRGLCRVGSCKNKIYADETSCVLHRKRGKYQCLTCDEFGHNSRRHVENK